MSSKQKPILIEMSFFAALLLISILNSVLCELSQVKLLPKCCSHNHIFDSLTQQCKEDKGHFRNASLFLGEWTNLGVNEYQWKETIGFPNCSLHPHYPHLRVQINRQLTSNNFRLIESHVNNAKVPHYLLQGPFGSLNPDYCLDHTDLGGTMSAYCEPSQDEICHERPCFQSCCPQGFFQSQNGSCIPTNDNVKPPELRDTTSGGYSQISNDIKYYDDKYVKKCSGQIKIYYENEANVTVWEDGRLQVRENKLYSFREYCINQVNGSLQFKTCEPSSSKSFQTVGQNIVTYVSVVSVVCYVMSFSVIWHKRRNTLFGVMLLCLITYLTIFMTSLVTIQFTNPDFMRNHSGFCQFIGFTLYYSYMSSSCWLACLGINVYTTFRKIRNPLTNSVSSSRPKGWQHPHFVPYLVVSNVIPMLMLSITLTMQLLPKRLTQDLITPDIGVNRCFIEKAFLPLFVYLHFINLPCNLIGFLAYICTSYNLCCGIWSSRGNNQMERSTQQFKAKMVMLVKLFFVLGVSWILEEVSLVLRAYGVDTNALIFCDVINAGQGILLFLCIIVDSNFFGKMASKHEKLRKEFIEWKRKQKEPKVKIALPLDEDTNVKSLSIRLRDENSCSDINGSNRVISESSEDWKIIRPLMTMFKSSARSNYEAPINGNELTIQNL